MSNAEQESATIRSLKQHVRDLEAELEECRDTLEAIRSGAIDAVVVNIEAEHHIYTLANSDTPYRVLIEQIQEGAFTIDLDGTIFYCNRRFAEMLNRPHQQIVGHNFQTFLLNEDQEIFRRTTLKAFQGGYREEMTLQFADHAPMDVYVSLSALECDGDNPLLCGVMTDLTLQKHHVHELAAANERLVAESEQRILIEEALRQSQKMEAVGQLTGGLAHDFNNLLTGISGSLQLMKTRLDQGRSNELGRYIDAATASANRAAALTHRLLAFSRRQTLDPKNVAVNQLVSDMTELLQRTIGPTIDLRVELADPLGNILCDPNQLENALLNLVINARDAMPSGGTIQIRTADVDFEPAFAKSRDMAPGSYIAVSVTDDGAGMPPAVVARAFDPFFTTKPLGIGTGLGLSMIYGFAKQSGGQVRIHSKPEMGTTVVIYLPRFNRVAEKDHGVASALPAQTARQGQTVLVVDDEPVVRMLILEVLSELGYTVLEAEDGATGLRQLDRHRHIDLLITDVGLPGGMNGRQLADAARVNRQYLKVLFITGFAENTVLGDGGLEDGMEVMTKPFVFATLANRIQKMIGN